MHEVAVVDYGMGNLLSVQRGFERCGSRVKVTVTADPDSILAASHVVLPGVGAFSDGMAELRRQGLNVVLNELVARGTPLLGICLGMQMLFDESDEFGATAGLGLIPGRVIPIPSIDEHGLLLKIPHVGWNMMVLPPGRQSWQETPLADVTLGAAVYFVHSFMANPTNSNHRIADCLYGGVRVCAAIGRDNIWGCQFHPEKSGDIGLNILRRFCAD